MNPTTKKVTTIAMLCALSYIVMAVGRIPIVMFLSYDPKDVIITIGGFIFGPLSAALISLIVSFVEMLSVSDTGPIGLIMNVLATCAFSCTAAYFYKKNHSLKGAVIGLVLGTLSMTAVMLLWNYLITPMYLGYPREAVAAMLVPMFLPFNLLKGGLNAAITMLLYKPVVSGLRKAGLIPPSSHTENAKSRNLGVFLISAFALVTFILFALVLKGVL